MGNKRKAKKRQNQDVDVIEVALQKKRLLEDDVEEIQASTANLMKDEKIDEEKLEILPTREILGNQLVVAVKNRNFAIVEGPLGCGKTYLAQYAARKLSLAINIMQMGDQIDSKTLFGNYHCTEVAGQFVWKESTFSKWLKSSCVIVLEDIDAANSDVISKIVEIAENRKLGEFGEEFHEDVRIIGTMSGKGKKAAVLDGVPVRIKLDKLSDDELKRLASKSFPRISHLTRTLISVFRKLESVPGTSNSRHLTSTDFLRGCNRLSKLSDISANLESFAELVDVWCLADPKDRAIELCNRVSSQLNVTPDRVHTHLSIRQPDVKYDDKHVMIGRANLARKISMIKTGRHRLGHTRDVVQLMERIVVCVSHNEPLLLVGETGVGKTSVVQAVADLIGVTLDVVNVSPTSDSDELIQGYKPTTIGRLMEPFTKFYMDVFLENFDKTKNQKFIDNLEKCLASGRFSDYLSLVETTARKSLENKSKTGGKIDERWAELLVRSRQIREGLEKGAAPFQLQKGAVLEAAEKGHWLLVDEINLAPPECLDAIIHAWTAQGTHKDFRLFACMNPATDAGKRRLPAGVRTKFTEFFVSETTDPHQLSLIISAYLPTIQQSLVENLVNFYQNSKQLYPSSYSLRTLCRALLFTADAMFASVEQSIYEAVSMAFLTNLETEEKSVMRAKIDKTFKYTAAPMPMPKNPENYVKIGGYFIEKGDLLPEVDPKYVQTKTVKQNMAEISRIVCSGRFPILLEGETSAGKTSIVCHLGKVTGNRIVRINNHEHTDIQEYMGSYVADDLGRLVFREGALVKAVRNGEWVILDELNLAPTDVIEALNRLLDDNRELFVPEINETIKAHPRFRLFATQNPAGSYAGRKKLSRALMSRFIVLRFHHLPIDELSEMVCARCGVPPTAAHKMIEVLNELRNRRSLSGLFSARDGLMTLRDVFRWAKRMTTDGNHDDWLQILVNHGYFLLAGRCRNEKDEKTVEETLEKVIKRKIEKDLLFSMNSVYMPKDINVDGVILTLGMRRMLVLTEQAWLRNEAVLMVGETGGGKTTLSEVVGRGKLRSINCHERTETADLLGRLRPKQDGGFEWSNGVVISSMRDGVPLLIDEISLAEDSVLERLNPLFEEDRSLLLSDAGTETELIESKNGFQMIATMNPGGDYGKKELSKALRNRFTEVWTSSDYEESELEMIFDQRLRRVEATKDEAKISPTSTAKAIVRWILVFFEKYSHVVRHPASVRDVVACAELYASAISCGIDRITSIKDALCAVFLDSLAGLTARLNLDPKDIFEDALVMLHSELVAQQFFTITSSQFLEIANKSVEINLAAENLQISHLKVPFGTETPKFPKTFSLHAPTCAENFYRIARGLLINKPILLEGAPGCGKSSTVMALAQLTGNRITRLNLSDQTDLSDLFGSDVPMISEDGKSMSFRWEDGPVLKAIKNGEWILLDEMNLASQSVLEGLNACFDHRRILYIAELNREFEIPSTSNCRFFACQNPRVQGGNRRALPKSFVNRFTNIYTNDLTKKDIEIVLAGVDEKCWLSDKKRKAMVEINEQCSFESERNSFLGGPHSFNLRDLLRWFELSRKIQSISEAFEICYMTRMRREEDRLLLKSIFEKLMDEKLSYPRIQLGFEDENILRIGKVKLARRKNEAKINNRILSSQIVPMHQIATCIQMNWLALLVGPRNSGKRAICENLAALTGQNLRVIALNADTDAQELIGSYEQFVDENVLQYAQKEIEEILGESLENSENLMKLEANLELILARKRDIEETKKEEIREILRSANKCSMRFEWTDSVFVDAYLKGDWLLIEDVNLCSAAVLDRLNSCLESGGKLVVAERQNSYEPLEPHPNFRVFLSMDSRIGEISRAMRNRSVEIYLDEKSRWTTSENDISSVISPNLPFEMRQKIGRFLTAEQQLHLAVLLKEDNSDFSAHLACKLVGLVENMEIMEEENDEDIIVEKDDVAPEIDEISTLSNTSYETWILKNWLKSARKSKCANVEAFLLTILSASPFLIFEMREELGQIFGRQAIDSLIHRVLPILENQQLRRIPIDLRFSGFSSKKGKIEDQFNSFVIFEWMLQIVQKIMIEEGSAENLSKTMSKYELSTCEVGFKNLGLISKLVANILEMWRKENSADFSVEMSYLLIIAASRRKLSLRTGCAAIYLAWNDLRQQIPNKKMSKFVEEITLKMNEGWSAESYEEYVNEYLLRWRDFAICRPFENKSEVERYGNRLEAEIREENQDVEMIDEENENEEPKKKLGISPVELVNNIVDSVEAVHEFLAQGIVDESDSVFKRSNVYNGLNWNDEKKARWIRTVALLCAKIGGDKNEEDEQESDDILVSHLASIGGGAHCIAARLFFSSLRYNPNLANLSIAHLQKFPIKELGRKMWKLSVNGEKLREELRKSLDENGLEGWTKLGNQLGNNKAEIGLEMMRNALPPKETLDPLIFEEERRLFLNAKRRIVEKQLKLLEEFRYLNSRQEKDDNSPHPVLKKLQELQNELNDIPELETSFSSEVYRQSATQYNHLCAEMSSFFQLTQQINNESSKNEQDPSILLARLKSFSMSSASFRIGLLRKFVSFVDIHMQFIAGLLLVEVELAAKILELQQEAKRRNAWTESMFPRIVKTFASENGLDSNEVSNWSIRDSSPMPLQLKAAIVRKRLIDFSNEEIDGNIILDIQWTRNQWKKWYERNISKGEQKDFVYRTKTEEEKDELDILEFFSKQEQDSQVLHDNEVSLLLEAIEKRKISLVDPNTRFASDARFLMAKSWMRYLMSETGNIPQDALTLSQCVDGDQKLFEVLENVVSSENETSTKIDVYRSSSLQECRKVAEILERLEKRTREVLERWPEVVSLKTILESIHDFFLISISMPHIKMAQELEKLIELCENWEMMADRQNSLREPLGDLRKLLVEWKKMEVRCWATLLENCENEAKQKAQLVVFPLFEMIFSISENEEEKIVAMSIEWMHNSTLVDFEIRVKSIENLGKWAKLTGKLHLSEWLTSASRHFSIFVPKIEERLRRAREPAEQSLKDYLKVVKYNDLNLWNIRVSSTKAHAQLYKIVRRFKDAISAEVDEDFETLQKLDEIKKRILEEIQTSSSSTSKIVQKTLKFSKTIVEKAELLANLQDLEELEEQTKQADESIRTLINYIGEDSEKEKQQGYARNSRQRQIAMVIKEAQAIGLNARKSVILNQESINRRCICEVGNNGESENGNEIGIRKNAAGRNIVIKKALKIDQQVGVATRKHLSGMIEYGMHYMLNLHDYLTSWKSQTDKISKNCAEIESLAENQQSGFIIDHEIVSGRVENIAINIEKIEILIGSILRKLAGISDGIVEQKEYWHPLTKLSKSDDLAAKLMKWSEKIGILMGNMKRTNEQIIGGKRQRIVRSENYQTWKSQISGDIQDFQTELENENFTGFFDVEKLEISKISQEILKISEKQIDTLEDHQSVQEELDNTRILLVVQDIYKGFESLGNSENDEAKILETIIKICDVLKLANIGKLADWTEEIVENHICGTKFSTNLSEIAEVLKITWKLLGNLVKILENAQNSIIPLYHSILSMTIQLYEKGYINPIPKADNSQQESGNTETDNSGEGGGIGEGGTAKDAKDVTDEMEESGQIEGLEDDEQVDSNEHESKNDNEKPIDMEDDFAEDLQDIDKNEKGDDKNDEEGNDESDEEPDVEDQMGDVEEEDEKQLDPKMWEDEEEKEEENQQKNMDEEQEGAEDKSKEMVAKEDNAQKEGENEEKEDENEAEENENDQENVDERDRENEEDLEDDNGGKDEKKNEEMEKILKDDEEIDEDASDDEEEKQGDDQEKMEEDKDDGDDKSDIEGEGDEEMEENNLENENADQEKAENENEDEAEKMEQGTGGEKSENEKNDQEDGGNAEDEKEEEHDEEEKEDEKGEGKTKSDPKGKDGKGQEKQKKKEEENEKDEEDDEGNSEEKEEKQRKLAENEENTEEDDEAEMGEGEEDEENGQQRENAEVSDRTKVGKGTLEEARETKRDVDKEKEKKRRREDVGDIFGDGEDDGIDENDENSEIVQESRIFIENIQLEQSTSNGETSMGNEGIPVDNENRENPSSQMEINEKADEQWAAMSRTVGLLAAELAENLRLILEPQRANKMQGDYRSGKRLNMRRLIPYIASEYRKDRIWMRRTKRAQREYQIMIAVDDSGSMNENGIHEVTCESVCIVEDALRRCDAGRVSVCSFGSDVNTIIPFGEATAASSVEMLKKLTFNQTKTDLLCLLRTAKSQLDEIRTPTSEQMLIIISDGRGTLSQGADKVRQLYASLQGVTVLFVILDSGKKSIEELSVASFKDGKVVLTPYLSLFPFPFYAIVKSIQQLPNIISESIRQWFEMTISANSF
ncbi:unnamed protein product [Caenorhabditis angaria]|uniref:Midasin n=1 Tax=Caenorhabditis angaria TaxID=860376 RepID=A0A9P1N2V9_9PELO|nr:unnamed protein product [Caenorhabditis angaria]